LSSDDPQIGQERSVVNQYRLTNSPCQGKYRLARPKQCCGRVTLQIKTFVFNRRLSKPLIRLLLCRMLSKP
ncbi:MAG: hypothetical protein AABZ61_09135, partial [Bacteroidota bacterium]